MSFHFSVWKGPGDVPMRQVRELLRLSLSSDVPGWEIARRLGIAASTVRGALKRFRLAGLNWPVAEGITEEELEEKLYGKPGPSKGTACSRILRRQEASHLARFSHHPNRAR
jgi:transposase-like protein